MLTWVAIFGLSAGFAAVYYAGARRDGDPVDLGEAAIAFGVAVAGIGAACFLPVALIALARVVAG